MRLLAVVLGLLFVAGCGAAPVPSASPIDPPVVLEGTSWRATLVGGEAPAADHPVTLELEGGRVGGNTGCNSYGADARLDGGRLVVDEVQMTLAACVDALPSRLEGTFLQILQERPTLITDGSRLLLRGPTGEVVFEPGPSAG